MLTRMIRRKLQMRFQMNHHKLTPLPLKKLLKRMERKSETAESEGEEGVTTDEGIVGSDDDVESEKELQKNHNNDIIETEQSEQLVE